MAIQDQPININFAQGLDSKSDPFQLQLGKFQSLENSVFNKGGLLQKRNGFGPLTELPDLTSSYLTTFNGDLTAIGNRFQAYISGSDIWVDKGLIQPVDLSVLTLIRTNTNQSQVDTAISPNGLVCTVYTDNIPSGGTTTPSYKYAIADSITGQNVVPPTVIPDGGGVVTGGPRVWVLGNYFIIVFGNNFSGTYRLQYIAISYTNTSVVIGNTTISTSYLPLNAPSFDGVIANAALYLAWNAADGGMAIRMTLINPDLSQPITAVKSGLTADYIAVTADTSGSTPVIWVAYSLLINQSQSASVFAVNQNLNTVLAPTLLVSTLFIRNITLVAANAVASILLEVDHAYGYDSSIQSRFIEAVTCTQSGTVTVGSSPIVRSVGLASKAFFANNSVYFLAAYQSPYQPTYFLLDYTGINNPSHVVAKLAYGNGGGYLSTGLPSVSVSGNQARIPYLFKDLIASVNKNTNVPAGSQVNGIYSQLGINIASFNIGDAILISAEIATNLNITGGFLWSYDGYVPVEQNFHVWPDSVEAKVQTDPTPTTGNTSTTTNPNVITAVASIAGIGLGMNITGAGIPANTLVIGISSTTVTISNNVTATATGVTLTFTGNLTAQAYYYQAVYEWTDNQGNINRSAPSIPVQTINSSGAVTNPSAGHTSATVFVPTLRLTYKTANPVKIVIYRWSAAQQVYYQVTSIQYPLLNSTTSDFVSFIDGNSDAAILGNSIIYTNGGVVENIAPPATSSVFLFDDRLFSISSEDPNLLTYSKQIIENTPVEMSDLFTIYVAPAISSEGSSGPLRCGFPMDDKAILFKDNSILYINGSGPDNTGANGQYSQPILITSTVGCANQRSIVFTPNGLMFQSNKGIWLLGRDMSTTYIGAAVEAYNGALVESALVIPGTNQVRFTLDSGVTLMYDYFYAQWSTFVNIPGISSTVYQGLHTYLNDLGQVFQETPGLYLDNASPVLIKFTTSWLNLAGLKGYERFKEFNLLGVYYSPHKLVIQVGYDYNPPSHQSVYTPNNYSPVYGYDPLYGNGSPFGGPSAIEKFRVFTKKQKCESMQISLQEVFDASYGVNGGAGLSLSGINAVMGFKKGWSPNPGRNSVG